MAKQNTSKQQDFESGLRQLEKLVDELESGELNLDESLNRFEEGVKLYKTCRSLLGKAEKRINLLTEALKEEVYEPPTNSE